MTEMSGDTQRAEAGDDLAHRLTVLLLAILLAVVVDGLLFGLVGLVAWLYRPEVTPWNRHLIDAARSVVAFGVVAAVLAWWFLRESPPLLQPGGWIADPTTGARRRINFTRWLVSMRWAAVAAIVLVTFAIVHVVGLLDSGAWWPLFLLTLLLAAFNLVYSLLSRRGVREQILIPLQIYVDLTIFAVMLHFSAGVQNPLGLLMIIHVVLGGLMLPRRQCYAIAVFGSVLFA